MRAIAACIIFAAMSQIATGPVFFIALILVTAVQLFYYCYFFRRLAFYKPKVKKEFQQHPVSIIVCGKNERKNFVRNIPGLVFQKYAGSYEIVAVNDNSTDNTKQVLEKLKKEFGRINIIEVQQEPERMAGKKYPLSLGIAAAKHEILLLTDADCVPASEFWLQKMQDVYEDGIDIVLGYGQHTKRPGLLNKIIRFETFHTALQYLSYALAGIPYMAVGRNLSYKKSLFTNNKGFAGIDHVPGGDDDLFINKVATAKNTAIVIEAAAHTLSSPKTSWAEWKRQKSRHYSTSNYYKPLHKWLLGLYSFSHFLFYPLLMAACFFYNWQSPLIIFLLRFIIQLFVFARCMKKLNETDLIQWILFMDIWMFFYYIFFAPMLLKKGKRNW